MKFFRTILASGAAVAVVAALSACGASTATTTTATATTAPAKGAMMAAGITVTMTPQNGSKQSGSGTVTAKSGGVMVTFSVMNEPKGASEPAHIHAGTCGPKLNPKPWKVLANVVNGKSSTLVAGVTIAQLKKGPYAINVHKSLKQISVYVSCGNL